MFGSQELCSPRVVSPLREEISTDEELALLPRHTKVVVTGNNRTKSVLVGLQGVVKKAVGLGGWHWLVLKNGVEVKLQRNALSVLEHPTSNDEEEGDLDCENSSSSSDTGDRDTKFCNSMDQTRARYAKFATHVKLTSLSDGVKRVRPVCSPRCGVNFGKLGTESLLAYCRQFNLGSFDSNSSRVQLILAVERHFSIELKPLDEALLIPKFVKAASKRRRGESSPGEPRSCKDRHL